MTIRFMHCSDLHIGFAQFGLDERFQDFGQAFSQIAHDALAKKVDYFLIAGDFFNKRSINSRTLNQAMQTLQQLQGGQIKVLAIEGNHDKAPYGEGDSWMRFLHDQGLIQLLQPEFAEGKLVLNDQCIVEFPGIRFIGLGYLGSMTQRRLLELKEQLKPSSHFTVLIMHAAVDRLLHLGGVARGALAGLEDVVDYVALGHVHERYELEDWIYNPGAPENWDLGEGGKEKGYYDVTLDGKRKSVIHLLSTPRPIYDLKLKVPEQATTESITDLCLKSLGAVWNSLGEAGLVRVTLIGQVEFNPLAIAQDVLIRELEKAFPIVYTEIVNQVSLKGQGQAEFGNHLSRGEIEEAVLRSLVKSCFGSEYASDPNFCQEAVQMGQELKTLSALGHTEGMLGLVTAWAKRLKGQEVHHEDLSAQAN